MNVNKDLEDMVDQWAPLLHKGLESQKGLLDIALTAYDPFFLKGKDDRPVYKHLSKDQLKEIIKGLKEDVIPMYKESSYDEGIEKANIILEKLQKG